MMLREAARLLASASGTCSDSWRSGCRTRGSAGCCGFDRKQLLAGLRAGGTAQHERDTEFIGISLKTRR